MTKRIFRGIVLTAIIAVLLASMLTGISIYRYSEARAIEELRSSAGYILLGLSRSEDETAYFQGFSSQDRVTLVDGNGNVLYDNQADATSLENHLDRPEIQAALRDGTGESRRYSNTLAEMTFYYTARTSAGNVLRIANTRSSALGMYLHMLPLMVVITLAAVLGSLLVARVVAKRIVAPMNALNLDAPLENDVYDELSPLLLRMERQRQEIARQMRQLAERKSELSAIAENMREGLVLLDPRGMVLSMNESAAAIFGVSAKQYIGEDMLCVNRDAAVRDALLAAENGGSADDIWEQNGRYYRLLASPVLQDSETLGIVLLMLDTTEKYAAEISRKEFTANVSHELKTPLTSISGYAEIMRDGVARPEDVQKFSSRICQETSRLIALINDILELSRLDEKKGLGVRERVNLLELSRDVVGRLEPLAREKSISLTLKGENCQISGYPLLLNEMFCNLVDNAIRYTPAGGNVDVRVGVEEGKPAFCVSDTGIGIPAEHQPHVFERFYRVDKSHSKATGGTGLGLSIVKHGAEIHGAEIRLESEPGQGTRIQLVFPAD